MNVIPKAVSTTESPKDRGRQANRRARGSRSFSWLAVALLGGVLLLSFGAPPVARAQGQTQYAPVVLTPPIVDETDENHVSMITGETHFTIPALKMGDVSFTPFSVGPTFQIGGLDDQNYGRLAQCTGISQFPYSWGGPAECTTATQGIQAIYGEARDNFSYSGSTGQYSPDQQDGSTFVDNGSTCTWTQRDGTRIIYAAYHVSGNPLCYSNNITQVIHPDGRIATYYYYGAFSTTYDQLSPIISIATNSGYMLKYNYSGTPAFGTETSVVAINRAFQACDPTAISCALTQTWPTATLSWPTKELASGCDNFVSIGQGYDPCRHYILTIQDEAKRSYVFELDSYSRIISYQPPEATAPIAYYALCSHHSDNTMTNCWAYTSWPPTGAVYGIGYDTIVEPLLPNLVASVARNGQPWNYTYNYQLGNAYSYSQWGHSVQNPQGNWMGASGNATPGRESQYGPIDSIGYFDGRQVQFARSLANQVAGEQTPAGLATGYGYDSRSNVNSVGVTPIAGSGQTPISKTASYPATCASILTCNEPTSITDAKGNTWNMTYDPVNGEVWTQTGPAVPGVGGQSVQPQTRYFYSQLNAWYLSSSGSMSMDPNPIWVLTGESFCMSGSAAPLGSGGAPAAAGAGCTQPNDEVVTSYDYGPASGPNNLLVRGKSVSARGQTLRTCFGHDPEGNKLWETSPNGNPSSCPSY